MCMLKVLAQDMIHCQIVDYKYNIDGEVKELNNSAFSVNGTTYLPIREIAEQLDLYVEWNDNTKTIEISDIGISQRNNRDIHIIRYKDFDSFITNFKVKINGYDKQMESPVLVFNDTSYLPLREISEIMGFNMDWNENNMTITINSNKKIKNRDETLYPFMQDKLWGYMNAKGEVKIEPQFAEAYDFSEGLAVVGVLNNDKSIDTNILYGYINMNGEFVISPVYYEAYDFSEGLAAVALNKDGSIKDVMFEHYGDSSYIDKSGNVIIDDDYQSMHSFHNGYAAVYSEKNHYGYVDKKGNFITVDTDHLNDFQNGYVIIDNKIIDTNFEVVFDDDEYENIMISDKFIIARKNGKYGVIDLQKNLIIDFKYDYLCYTNDEYLFVFMQGDKYGYVDINDNVIINPNYDFISEFTNDIAVIYDNKSKKYKIINKRNEILLELNVNIYEAKILSHDLIRTYNKDDTISYINLEGNIITPH